MRKRGTADIHIHNPDTDKIDTFHIQGGTIAEGGSTGQVSDGYHTFDELYYYRMLYHALWVNAMYDFVIVDETPEVQKAWDLHKSRKHSDGELCFGGGWFIVTISLPTGQVSNHYEEKYWDLFHIDERETASEWDGHTPEQAAERLKGYMTGDGW